MEEKKKEEAVQREVPLTSWIRWQDKVLLALYEITHGRVHARHGFLTHKYFTVPFREGPYEDGEVLPVVPAPGHPPMGFTVRVKKTDARPLYQVWGLAGFRFWPSDPWQGHPVEGIPDAQGLWKGVTPAMGLGQLLQALHEMLAGEARLVLWEAKIRDNYYRVTLHGKPGWPEGVAPAGLVVHQDQGNLFRVFVTHPESTPPWTGPRDD